MTRKVGAEVWVWEIAGQAGNDARWSAGNDENVRSWQ